MVATRDQEKVKERSQPKAELLLPPRHLASCIYGAFVRDTRNCELEPKAMFNHFAASPLCALSWCFEGACSLVEIDKHGRLSEIPVENVEFSGPQSKAATSVINVPVYAMTIAF